MTKARWLCLTLDLENDWYFDDPSLDHLVLDYLENFLGLLKGLQVPLSVFVVGKTLEKFPAKIRTIQKTIDCEFHLHSYQHDITKSYDFETEVRRGMNAYRNYFGRDPIGYRAPQGNIKSHEFRILEELGFFLDSSVFPSYRPGKYNNLTAPTEPYTPAGVSSLLEIPFGTFRGLRIPTSHSYFKLFGQPLSSYLSIAPLPEVLVYNVHLHDLYRTASHDRLSQPKQWIMKRNLENAETILQANISTLLSRGYKPVRITDVYEIYEGVPSNREASQLQLVNT